MNNYKDIFYKTENTLRKLSKLSETEFNQQFGQFKKFENKKWTDDEIFNKLVLVIFYSGFKSSIVEKKEQVILEHFPNFRVVSQYSTEDFDLIMADNSMIRHKEKIKGCITNAIKFNEIVDKHGSFQNFLDSFNPNSSFENLILLKEKLNHFAYIGDTTVYHLLSDLGFNVLKPDRVILRIFKRLGLIEKEEKLSAIKQGQQFAIETGLPIRYIDIVFVKYGQIGASNQFGLESGICMEKNPKCNLCELTSHCVNITKTDTE